MINLKSTILLRSVCSFIKLKRNSHRLNVVKLNRTLLDLKGSDTFQFLQGLITNDIRQFLSEFHLPNKQSIYSLLLQTNGRTLADFILYNYGKITEYKQRLKNGRLSNDDFEGDLNHSIILECDPNIKANLLKLLKIYKLKKNLELNENNRLSVWCIYSPDLQEFKLKEFKDDLLMLNKDPRLDHLGYRCLTTKEDTFEQLFDRLKSLNLIESKQNLNEVKLIDYIHHRYKLGIGEGLIDHPSGQCLPLEDNADLLNGIDFNKGCYLGQELVARTHYTGVVRKRLMPIEVIKFNNQNLSESNVDQIVLKEKVKFGITLTKENNPQKRLGKLRTICSSSNLGLAVVYHKELESCNYLATNSELGLLVKINKPIWWPDQLN